MADAGISAISAAVAGAAHRPPAHTPHFPAVDQPHRRTGSASRCPDTASLIPLLRALDQVVGHRTTEPASSRRLPDLLVPRTPRAPRRAADTRMLTPPRIPAGEQGICAARQTRPTQRRRSMTGRPPSAMAHGRRRNIGHRPCSGPAMADATRTRPPPVRSSSAIGHDDRDQLRATASCRWLTSRCAMADQAGSNAIWVPSRCSRSAGANAAERHRRGSAAGRRAPRPGHRARRQVAAEHTPEGDRGTVRRRPAVLHVPARARTPGRLRNPVASRGLVPRRVPPLPPTARRSADPVHRTHAAGDRPS